MDFYREWNDAREAVTTFTILQNIARRTLYDVPPVVWCLYGPGHLEVCVEQLRKFVEYREHWEEAAAYLEEALPSATSVTIYRG